MARQIAMYLMRNLTNLPLKEIGEEFGGRNHATVLSSIRKVEELLKSDPEIAVPVRDLPSNITNNLFNTVFPAAARRPVGFPPNEQLYYYY